MLKGASATLLLTLAARAAASRVVPEMAFQDELAGHIARHSPYELASYAQDPGFVRGVVLRSALMDDMARAFFAQHPDGVAVSLGAGLCTRRQRLIASKAITPRQPWLHLDLPDVIALRHTLLPSAEGERDLACSLLDEAIWLPELPAGRATLFILEGVCPYLPDAALRAWFTRMGNAHRHACMQASTDANATWQIVLDFVDPALLNMPTQVGDMNLPLQSAFIGVEELLGLHGDMQLMSAHQPFSRFSPGHAQFEAGIRARTGRPLYTIAHMTWRRPDGPD
jgi:hypothetical protein